MFGIYAPITYNTNLNSFFGGYYSPYFAGYSPFVSMFNAVPYYGGISMGYPYVGAYQYNNYNSNVFAMNYASPVYYGGGGSSASAPVTTPVSPSVTPSSTHSKTSSALVTNPSKPTSPKTSKGANNVSEAVSLGREFVSVARKYSDCAEYDNSHLKFCNNPTCKIEDPLNEEWCTDFVTYVVKEAYKNKGKYPPAGFGNHDVRTMKNWAINNGYFIRTTNKPRKGEFISKNIRTGDIMVINENNFSHTGIVTKVDSDGVIHTIEGNRDDRVKEYHYSPNYPNLSGFIRLTS